MNKYFHLRLLIDALKIQYELHNHSEVAEIAASIIEIVNSFNSDKNLKDLAHKVFGYSKIKK